MEMGWTTWLELGSQSQGSQCIVLSLWWWYPSLTAVLNFGVLCVSYMFTDSDNSDILPLLCASAEYTPPSPTPLPTGESHTSDHHRTTHKHQAHNNRYHST
ncbi:hypothetical protein AMELA_G00147220, partial [Ameiurus melas]